MNINTDLRATPAGFVTYLFLSLGFLGVILALTSIKFSWPVESDGALGLGSIFGAVGFGTGIAFLKRRIESFDTRGHCSINEEV